ncbi:MAG: L,D-transpeptidase family protein [Chloroflexota bacterium]
MTRGFRAATVATLTAAMLLLSSLHAAADQSSPVPPAPTGLTMSLVQAGTPVAPGGWINHSRLALTFNVSASSQYVTPQVELQPTARPFTGLPNSKGAPTNAGGPTAVVVHGLKNGVTYHWQARVVTDAGAASPWVAFGTTGRDFGVDRTAPSRPTIQSRTDPISSRWYSNHAITVTWSSHDSLSGIRGYYYRLLRHARVIKHGPLISAPGIKITNLADGVWFVAVRAVDRAGNWSPTATFRMQLDRQKPQLTWLSPTKFAFNPYKGPTTLQFKTSENARVKLDLYRVGAKKPVRQYYFAHRPAGQITTIHFAGKQRNGKYMPKGYYFFSVKAVDRANNISKFDVGGIRLDPQKPIVAVDGVQLYSDGGKRIIVSLSQQKLYAYNGDHLYLWTLVTTGNPALPTPAGNYTILAKYHPYEFISPWPVGSPFYYAPSPVQYAMLFRQGGYFLHDAPWRSAFGPGTNGPGEPGTNYGGSHGCINMPLGPTIQIWDWAPIGTPVQVVP